MLSLFLSQISHDFISLSFITFVTLYMMYMAVIKIHVYQYKTKHKVKPIHYKTFRLYSKSLISNAPSKKEKKFYATTNKITYVFNGLLVTAFVIYLLICFR
jgi:vacuolar-type H+-ATPase subunit C/Vma6